MPLRTKQPMKVMITRAYDESKRIKKCLTKSPLLLLLFAVPFSKSTRPVVGKFPGWETVPSSVVAATGLSPPPVLP